MNALPRHLAAVIAGVGGVAVLTTSSLTPGTAG